MSYRLNADETVEVGIRRVAREQIDKAITEINDPELDRHEAVHQVRKRCKKIRAAVRLVRPQFEKTYQRENAWYRDAAARLSYVRDAQSIIETFHDLLAVYEDQINRDAFAAIDLRLTERRDAVARDEVGLRERLDEFLAQMQEGRERVADWRIRDAGFAAVAGGLKKTYWRGRRARVQAYRKPSTESFHEWRKRAKYHWYHLRLLRSIWDQPMKARRDEADRLGDLLGDDHDLSVLRSTLLEQPDAFGGSDTLSPLIGLIGQRQAALRREAEFLGARMFAEKPKRLTRRFGAYGDAWEREQKQPSPGATHAPELVTV